MSTQGQTQAADAAATGQSLSLLEQAIGATKQTTPDRTQELLRTLTQEALAGTVSYGKNLSQTINRAIAAIDGE